MLGMLSATKSNDNKHAWAKLLPCQIGHNGHTKMITATPQNVVEVGGQF